MKIDEIIKFLEDLKKDVDGDRDISIDIRWFERSECGDFLYYNKGANCIFASNLEDIDDDEEE